MEQIDWEQLARYLNGEATGEDQLRIDEWLEADKANRELFGLLKTNWEKTGAMNKEKYDVDSAWNKLSKRISYEQQAKPEPSPAADKQKAPFLTLPLIRVAAVVVLILGIAYLLTNLLTTGMSDAARSLSFVSGPDIEQSFQLPDGSQVMLNASSKLDYRLRRIPNVREVSLEGEAFFDVSHNDKVAFIVHAGTAEIRVVGTSFNVKTSEKDQKTEVHVESGRVELTGTGRNSASVIIEPGFTGQILDKTLSVYRTENDNLLSWKTKDLIFRETNLEEVATVLNSTFHTNIEFEQDSIASLHFTGNFNDQPLDTVLKVLCTAFNLNCENRENSIILSLDK